MSDIQVSASPAATSNNDAPTPPISPVLIRAIFLLLGVGILIPWNAFVSAKPYFQARLCQDNTVIVDFEMWFGFVWNSSSVLALGFIIASVAVQDALCRRRRNNEAGSPPILMDRSDQESTGSSSQGSHTSNHSHSKGHSFWLVMVPLALYLFVFLLTDLLVLVPSIEPSLFLKLTLAGLAICGMCGAIATSGIISSAGLFESHLGITPFFSGQALGGVAVSLANVVAATLENPQDFWEDTCNMQPINQTSHVAPEQESIIVGTSTSRYLHSEDTKGLRDAPPSCSSYAQLDWAVFGYFFVGCIVLACCLVGFSVISRYQQEEHRDDYQVVQDIPVVQPLVDDQLEDQSPRLGLEMKSQRSKDDLTADQQERIATSYHDDAGRSTTTASLPLGTGCTPVEDFLDEDSVEPEEYTEEENELAVFSAIKGPWTCIFLVFSLTLCLFPSWVSQLRSVHQCHVQNRLVNDLYVPLSFVIFNIGDLCGRVLSERVPVTHIRHLSSKLVGAALFRLLLFPALFLMCVTEDHRTWFPIIPNDLYSLLVQFLFAITNGMLVSVSFMHAPHLVAHNTTMQERSSEMMTFAVSFGLLTGSLLSFPFATLASKL